MSAVTPPYRIEMYENWDCTYAKYDFSAKILWKPLYATFRSFYAPHSTVVNWLTDKIYPKPLQVKKWNWGKNALRKELVEFPLRKIGTKMSSKLKLFSYDHSSRKQTLFGVMLSLVLSKCIILLGLWLCYCYLDSMIFLDNEFVNYRRRL